MTALYELVLQGQQLPAVEGAPAPLDGAGYDGAVEVDAADLVLVKIRYKDVAATETDEAHEVSASLAPDDVAASEANLDAAFQWAIAVAAFAEILKDSPYADPTRLERIGAVAARPAFDDDADKEEFESLFARASALLEP